MKCPVCGSYGSDIYRSVMVDNGNCPHCGAPGDVIDRVDQLRQQRADEQLKAELEQALTDLGKVTAERDRLARIVEGVRLAMADELRDYLT